MTPYKPDRLVFALPFIPSAYGFVMWGFTYAIYEMRLMAWFPGKAESRLVLIAVLVCLALSSFAWLPAYRREARAIYAMPRAEHAAWQAPLWMLWILHVVGLAGFALYLREMTNLFGGLEGLVSVLLSEESYLVRLAEFDLMGVYLGYLGWIAIPLTILRRKAGGRVSWLMWAATVAGFCGNFLYLERTRPVWISFMAILLLLPFTADPSLRRMVLRSILIVVLGLAAFYGVAYWVGKTGEGWASYGDMSIPTWLGNLYYYLTGSFAYFEAIYDEVFSPDFVPQRTLYPLFKFLSLFGLAQEPAPQILAQMELPYPVNTGTFLEPLYADGGGLYITLGVVLATFAVDGIALACLKVRNPFTLFFWSSLCFASFISFFVPKLASTPIWLFGTIAVVAVALAARPSPGLATGIRDGAPLRPRGGD
jgi:hypothetical protein